MLGVDNDHYYYYIIFKTNADIIVNFNKNEIIYTLWHWYFLLPNHNPMFEPNVVCQVSNNAENKKSGSQGTSPQIF